MYISAMFRFLVALSASIENSARFLAFGVWLAGALGLVLTSLPLVPLNLATLSSVEMAYDRD